MKEIRLKPDEIKVIRQRFDYSREEFAEVLCLSSFQSMANIESGFRKPSKLTVRFLRYLDSLSDARAKTFIKEFTAHANE